MALVAILFSASCQINHNQIYSITTHGSLIFTFSCHGIKQAILEAHYLIIRLNLLVDNSSTHKKRKKSFNTKQSLLQKIYYTVINTLFTVPSTIILFPEKRKLLRFVGLMQLTNYQKKGVLWLIINVESLAHRVRTKVRVVKNFFSILWLLCSTCSPC